MFEPFRSALVWRGVLALVVGLVAVAWPAVTVGAFVVLFACYAFLAAGTDLAGAVRAGRSRSAVAHVGLAVLSAATGAVALARPGVTVVVLAVVVACWALASGLVQLAIAFRPGATAGERLTWTLGGLISVAFAVALVLRPDIGAQSLATVFGLFSMVQGIALLVLAAGVRKLDATFSPTAV